ncbi:MAG TPA: FecR domain-containing protein [Nitrosomonas sp.]|nr:FecR domain-containing protein [Nitrosomonas sp.]
MTHQNMQIIEASSPVYSEHQKEFYRRLQYWCLFISVKVILLSGLLLFSINAASADEWIYRMQQGDNLWNLTERHLTHLKFVLPLQRLNHIQNPFQIPPGTEIRIPIQWTRQQSSSALVLRVFGEAQLRRQGLAQPLPVVDGMQIFPGDAISTGEDAYVTFEFADQSILRLQDNSELRFERLEILGNSAVVSTEVNLQKGRTESQVPQHSPINSRFRIITPSAVSSVRGTDFRVGTNNDRAMMSEVIGGLVQVSNQHQSINIPSGFGVLAEANSKSLQSVPLLPPPDLSETPSLYERIPLNIPVRPLSGASGYRAQIALDESFTQLITDFDTASLPIRGGELPDGDYWLRIRGRDSLGLEGFEAKLPIRLNARPEPPFIIAPQHDSVVENQNPELQWAHQPGVAHYIIAITQKDSDFSTPIIYEPEVKGNRYQLNQSLEPGDYVWKIAAVSAVEGIGPYNDPLSFRVPVPGPALESTDVSDQNISFSWAATEPGQYFHFQFARDEDFKQLIVDTFIHESKITLPRQDSGRYYLRIKIIEADGTHGSFSPAQMIEIPSKYPYWLFLLLPLIGLLL